MVYAIFKIDQQRKVYFYANGKLVWGSGYYKINNALYEEIVDYINDRKEKNDEFERNLSEINKENLKWKRQLSSYSKHEKDIDLQDEFKFMEINFEAKFEAKFEKFEEQIKILAKTIQSLEKNIKNVDPQMLKNTVKQPQVAKYFRRRVLMTKNPIQKSDT